MSAVQAPPLVVESQPYFSALWLGRHPRDGQARVVACFGPSAPQDGDGMRATLLGFQPVVLGSPPPLTNLRGEFDGKRLCLHAGAEELWRTEPVPLSLATALHWRGEVLLVWVDVPLRDPQAELSLIGLQHVWTGVAVVSAVSPGRTAVRTSGASPRRRDESKHCRTAPAWRPA